MQDGSKVEISALSQIISGGRRIEDVATGWLHISHRGNMKRRQVSSVPHKERQIILSINTAYIIGHVPTKNCHSSNCFSIAW
jgi:hypothetical protein